MMGARIQVEGHMLDVEWDAQDGVLRALAEVPGGWVSARGRDEGELRSDFAEGLREHQAERAERQDSGELAR